MLELLTTIRGPLAQDLKYFNEAQFHGCLVQFVDILNYASFLCYGTVFNVNE